MTLHAAKGLEFPLVFLVGAWKKEFFLEAILRRARAFKQEERRLCYVGMTRAMQKLILSYAEVRRLYGREEYHKASRFLQELPEHLVDQVRVKAYFKPQASVPGKSFVQQNDSGLSLGQNVQHAKFGSGVVLAIEGSGPHTRVQVRFADDGVKWLVVAYANLIAC